MRFRFLTTTIFLLYGTVASAQLLDTNSPAGPVEDDEPKKQLTGLVAVGAAFAPTYDGSSKYKAGPFALVNLKYRGVEIKAVGTSLAVNFGGDSHFEFGPVLGLSSARKVSDTEGALKNLDPIKSDLEFGGFAGYHFGGDENGEGRILLSVKATKATKSSYGFEVDPSVSYSAIRRKKAFVSLDLGVKIKDAKSMKTTFGITTAEAARSGLSPFAPEGGISRVSAGATAGYKLTKHWGLVTRVEGGSYLGKASDSPIVKNGSKSFGLLAMGASFAF